MIQIGEFPTRPVSSEESPAARPAEPPLEADLQDEAIRAAALQASVPRVPWPRIFPAL